MTETTRIRPHKRPDREPCGIDGCGMRLYCKGYCVMHYSRLRAYGEAGAAERLRAMPGSGSINEYGYRVLNNPAHPLARAQGKVLEHRAVLYDSIGPGAHPCHWCGARLGWDLVNGRGGLNVDHLDDDKLNNDPANLVPACLDCNTKRGTA